RAPTEPRQTPPPDALGIRIGMSQKEARGRLEKVGRLLKEERKRQEVWALDRDPHFASMILGFDGEYRVRYVTLAARAGGAGRMRYSDVADVKGAQQTVGVNNYKYTWRVAARGGDRPGYVVVARGTDPQYLSYFSIKKIE
ncbi:MAG: hypothetical protein ACRD68_13520, partial [Pyrinomonadaceae bacterium]